MSKTKVKTKPFVLVTVHGGVATVWAPPDVDYEIVDWDNYDCQAATKDEVAEMKEIAERLEPDDRKAFLKQVDELDIEEEEDDG